MNSKKVLTNIKVEYLAPVTVRQSFSCYAFEIKDGKIKVAQYLVYFVQ